jgi:hypothetical protein
MIARTFAPPPCSTRPYIHSSTSTSELPNRLLRPRRGEGTMVSIFIYIYPYIRIFVHLLDFLFVYLFLFILCFFFFCFVFIFLHVFIYLFTFSSILRPLFFSSIPLLLFHSSKTKTFLFFLYFSFAVGAHGGEETIIEPDLSNVKPRDTYFMKGLFIVLICIFPAAMNRWIRNDKLAQASR